MNPRTLGRRMAMQYLFAAEVGGFDAVGPLDAFLAAQRAGEEDAGARFDGREGEKWAEAAAFAARLAAAALAGREGLDARLAAAADHWDFGRIAATEKSVLRMAAAELSLAETPLAVVADEAVKLAKIFGGADSGAFVNGVLMGFERAGHP